jgi:hypothetical protein
MNTESPAATARRSTCRLDDAPAPGGIGETLLSPPRALRRAARGSGAAAGLGGARGAQGPEARAARCCAERRRVADPPPGEALRGRRAQALAPARCGCRRRDPRTPAARADARQLEALEAWPNGCRAQRADRAARPGLPRPIAMDVRRRRCARSCAKCEALSFERMDAARSTAGLAASWTDTDARFRRIMKAGAGALPRLPQGRETRAAPARAVRPPARPHGTRHPQEAGRRARRTAGPRRVAGDAARRGRWRGPVRGW